LRVGLKLARIFPRQLIPMKIKKRYSLLSERLAELAQDSFDRNEKNLGELLTLVYTCYLVDAEDILLENLKTALKNIDKYNT
tara:strand:- start:3487 stop:3732 length:246 start_codon:yes stop_codon:yes gene_type:complete